MVIGAIVGVIALCLWLYVSYAAGIKGIIVTFNQMKRAKESPAAALINAILGAIVLMFGFMFFYLATNVKWASTAMWTVVAFAIAFSFTYEIKSNKRR